MKKDMKDYSAKHLIKLMKKRLVVAHTGSQAGC
jgi:hypothetical protein